MPTTKRKIDEAKKQNILTRATSSVYVLGFYILYFLLLFFSNDKWFAPIGTIGASSMHAVQFSLNFINLLMLVPIIYFVAKEITNLCFPGHKAVFLYTAISIFTLTMSSGIYLLLCRYGYISNITDLVKNNFTLYLIIIASGIVLFTIASAIVWIVISKNFQYVAKKTKVWFTLLNFIVNTFFVGFFYVTIIHQWTTFLILIAISNGADMFAYFGGMLFGKHKMAPNISPKKTWEGLIFGILVTLLCMCGIYSFGYIPGAEDRFHALYCFLGNQSCSMSNNGNLINLQPYYWSIYVFATLAIMIVSVLGDLFFSWIKRSFNIKDFSNLLPGHGGILDRLDALIFTFSFYFVVTIIIQLIMLALLNTNVVTDKTHIDGLYYLWHGKIPNFVF